MHQRAASATVSYLRIRTALLEDPAMQKRFFVMFESPWQHINSDQQHNEREHALQCLHLMFSLLYVLLLFTSLLLHNNILYVYTTNDKNYL